MPITRWRWLSSRRLLVEALAIGGRVLRSITGVVGIPRSGMLPAAHIATHYHLPLGMASDEGITWSRAPGRPGRNAAVPNGQVLVIDDTLYSGRSIAYTRRRFRELGIDALFAAVFVRRPETAARVLDLWGPIEGDRHVNEWNVFNNGILRDWDQGIGLDLDGIICHDPPMNDRTEPTAYEAWLPEATPRWLPRSVVCPLILTARLEQYRPQTEDWLARHGVRFERLIMHPARDTYRRGNPAAWKARELTRSCLGAYIESHAPHAREIALLSRLPVICPDAEKVFDFREEGADADASL